MSDDTDVTVNECDAGANALQDAVDAVLDRMGGQVPGHASLGLRGKRMTHDRRTSITINGLPEGWSAEYVETRGYDSPDREIVARHSLYPTAHVGVGRRISPEDETKLLQRIQESEAPSQISHAQWLNIGLRRGWL